MLIEPTGLAHPGTIIDILRSPGIREHIELFATIGLVHPKHLRNERYLKHETYQDQIQMADILVANFWDEATEEEQSHFDAFVRAMYPPKLGHYSTHHAALKWEWLNTSPRVERIQRHEDHHHHHHHETEGTDPFSHHTVTGRTEHNTGGIATCGWVFPTDYVFDRHELLDVLQDVLHPSTTHHTGALRIKGVFRTKRVWLLVNGTPDMLNIEAINYRRDSRVEIITDAQAPEWSDLEERFKKAVCSGIS